MYKFWSDVFYLDRRSMALFRICVGALLAIELTLIWTQSFELFAPQGILSWSLIQEQAQAPWSLHGWITQNWQLHLLLGCQVFLAICFAMGAGTRWAALGSWILLVSLYNRNPVVAYGADNYLRFCMLWAVFLPLDTCWALRPTPWRDQAPRVVSIATVGYILHLIVIYMSAGLSKSGASWMNGTALAIVLEWNDMATWFGRWLTNHEDTLKLMTYATLAAEVQAPLLLLVPSFRWISIAVLVGLHLGIAMTMHLSIFPWIGIAVWLILIPSHLWDRRLPRGRWVVRSTSLPAPANFLCGLLLVLIMFGNLANLTPELPWPRWFHQLRSSLGLVEHWYFFAPDPPQSSYWIVAHGRDNQKQTIDLLRQHQPPDLAPGPKPAFNSIHWQGVFIRILNPAEQRVISTAMSRFFCRQQPELTQVTIYMVTQGSQAAASLPAQPRKRRIHTQYCSR